MRAVKLNPLRDVNSEPAPKPTKPDYAYESEQRKRIMSRDWASVHVTAHNRKPFAFFNKHA